MPITPQFSWEDTEELLTGDHCSTALVAALRWDIVYFVYRLFRAIKMSMNDYCFTLATRWILVFVVHNLAWAHDSNGATCAVSVRFTGVSRARIDVFATECLLKVNAPPYFFQADVSSRA